MGTSFSKNTSSNFQNLVNSVTYRDYRDQLHSNQNVTAVDLFDILTQMRDYPSSLEEDINEITKNDLIETIAVSWLADFNEEQDIWKRPHCRTIEDLEKIAPFVREEGTITAIATSYISDPVARSNKFTLKEGLSAYDLQAACSHIGEHYGDRVAMLSGSWLLENPNKTLPHSILSRTNHLDFANSEDLTQLPPIPAGIQRITLHETASKELCDQLVDRGYRLFIHKDTPSPMPEDTLEVMNLLRAGMGLEPIKR